MDGLSALSVAASVAQFIEFGCSLVSKSKEIYESTRGLPKVYVEAENATNRLLELSRRLTTSLEIEKQSMHSDSSDSDPLKIICEECVKLSEKLLKKLEKLRLADGQNKRHWKSFRQALKTVWSKSSIDEIAKRLQSYRTELDSHILISLSERFTRLNVLETENFASLDHNMQASIEMLLKTLINSHQRLEVALESHVENLDQRLESRLTDAYAREMALLLDQRTSSIILQSLRFPTMTHRRHEISEAHQETFKWIFEAPRHQSRPWSNFADWLQMDGELYWINGKAGSGKSTLMRYIWESRTSHRYLKTWADKAELRVAAFFFWNSGYVEQRSLAGLLRSLLYEVLRGRPDLIETLFKEDWDDIRTSLSVGYNEALEVTWSYKALEQFLKRLTSHASEHLKICFFIDGVDEYDGDHEAFVEFFQEVARSPFVKICMSSRPWLIFTDTLKAYPGLRLQDLTSKDIRIYIYDKLEANSKMKQLAESNPQAAATLVKEILTKANGVFLWVELVVKSLLSGLRNRDDISDLQQRLEELPSDLDDLYRHILDKIEPRYMESANRIFQIYDRASEINPRMTILELDLAVNATYADCTSRNLQRMNDSEIDSRCDIMTSHLSSRCAGFLEVQDTMDRAWESRDWESNIKTKSSLRGPWKYSTPCADPAVLPIRRVHKSGVGAPPPESFTRDSNDLSRVNQPERARLKLDLKVSYLHRTVKDFLKTEAARSVLGRHRLSNDNFDPNLVLFMSYIISFKRSICSYHIRTHNKTWKIVKDALHFAAKANALGEFDSVILLKELCRTGYQRWKEETQAASDEWEIDFLILAIRLGFGAYVGEALKQFKELPRGPCGSPLLSYAFGLQVQELTNPLRPQPTCPPVVEALLKHGADPNEGWTGAQLSQTTIWQHALQLVHDESSRSKITGPSSLESWVRVFKAMLHHGADVEATCYERHCTVIVDYEEFHSEEYQKVVAAQSHSLASVISDSFSRDLPAEEDILLNMLSNDTPSPNTKNNKKRRRKLSPVRVGSTKVRKTEYLRMLAAE
ncbi:hypothetical protein L207DRAFT_468687 [Hyaloscypha variabilis F]|uniref:NACHT domain-containing protein n=1 Tax=Hyaloscypha variabilis (strain UAMH 11265 / GT02V1 / F) TaxID=1149755 RepID=A0A2J6R7C2_HYAVF|nr:hypothetical protein L207DRAFT_468687 [Hyaloscypha variabilis F]